MRHARDRRRTAAAFYLVLGVVLLLIAWASVSLVVLGLAIAFVPLAAWAWTNYPVDRDW